MKNVNLLWRFCLLIISTLFFNSCSDSDNDSVSLQQSLANTRMYVYAEENYLNGEQVKGYPFTPMYWSFFDNGTCAGFRKGMWKMKGNTIVVTTNYSGITETLEFEIVESEMDKELDTWELVLRKEYDDDEFDYQLYYMRLVEVFEYDE